MSHVSLKSRLENYLRKVWLRDPNLWVHKGTLEDLCKQAGYLGDCGTRRLRESVAESKIERRIKNTSTEYKYIPTIEEIARNIDKLC